MADRMTSTMEHVTTMAGVLEAREILAFEERVRQQWRAWWAAKEAGLPLPEVNDTPPEGYMWRGVLARQGCGYESESVNSFLNKLARRLVPISAPFVAGGLAPNVAIAPSEDAPVSVQRMTYTEALAAAGGEARTPATGGLRRQGVSDERSFLEELEEYGRNIDRCPDGRCAYCYSDPEDDSEDERERAIFNARIDRELDRESYLD